MLSTGGTTTIGLYDFKRKTDTFGGVDYWEALQGGYLLNARVMLTNGDIVKSNVANNTVNPNVDMTGWVKTNSASQIFDESGLSQQGWNNGVDSIADLLAIPNPKNGNRAHVKSYYAGENKGGGTFIYDSTKSSVNNGVTIFNGWVRDLSDKVLTTDDAGLIGDGTDTNTTTRLNTFASLAQDNFTIKFFGSYVAGSQVVFSGVSGLKVTGVGEIVGDTANWTFGTTFNGWRGVLQFNDCPYTEIFSNKDFKVRGAQKYNPVAPEPWEDGDCAIHFINSPHSYVHHMDVGHTQAWAILAEKSPYTVVQNNIIDDVVRQSGVNVVVNDGKNCNVSYNTISNVGLYAIEWETYNPSDNNVCKGNLITDCYKGIVVTGTGITSVDVSHNIIKRCGEALTSVATPNAETVVFSQNHIFNCDFGGVINSSAHVTFVGNPIECPTADHFVYFSSHASILEVVSPNEFLLLTNAITFNTEFELSFGSDTGFFMTALTPVSNNKWGTGTVSKMTLNKNITNPYEGMMFKSKSSNSTGVLLLGTNTDVNVTLNPIKNFKIGIQSALNRTGTGVLERVSCNTFINGITSLYAPDYSTSLYFDNNEFIGASTTALSDQYLRAGQLSYKRYKEITNYVAKGSGGSNPVLNFSVPKNTIIIGIEVEFIGLTCTGSVVLKMDDIDNFIIDQTLISGSIDDWVLSGVRSISAGAHTIQMVDTVGDLAYTSYKVTLLTV